MATSASSQSATVRVKFQGGIVNVPDGSAFALKLSLSTCTPLAPSEMRLIHRGKTLGADEHVQPGATLMLTRMPAPTGEAPTLVVDVFEIVTGMSSVGLRAPASSGHEDLVELALSALKMSTEGESCCMRLYLPHVGSLMRADLTLADYAAGLAAGRRMALYLVPCPPELCADASSVAVSAEAEAAAQQRLQQQADAEAEAIRLAVRHMMTINPLSSVESMAEEEEEDKTSTCAPTEEEQAAAACEAALVPARIRTGLVPAADDIQIVHAPAELLADLEAFEAYDAEVRELAALPYAQAREMLVAAEEARLEERCALLIRTLPELGDSVGAVDAPASPCSSTPSAKSRPRGEGLRRQQPRWPRAAERRTERAVWKPVASAEAASAADDSEVLNAVEWSAANGAICRVVDDELAEVSTGSLMLPDALPSATAARKRPRCKACNCRLPLTAACGSTCQCGDLFCARHMHAHDCIVDYRSREQRKLQEDNPKLEASKLERLG